MNRSGVDLMTHHLLQLKSAASTGQEAIQNTRCVIGIGCHIIASGVNKTDLYSLDHAVEHQSVMPRPLGKA